MKLNEWLSKWLEVYVKCHVRQSTYKKYCRIINNHITPYLGDRKLNSIKADDIRQLLYVELYERQKLPNGSVKTVISIMKSA